MSIIKKYFPIILLISASATFYFLNILIKKELPNLYTNWVYIIFILTLFPSVCFSAFDSYLIRESQIYNNKIKLPKKTLSYAFISATLFSIIFTIFSDFNIYIFLSLFLTAIGILISITLRLDNQFLASQYFNFSWKLSLAIIVLYCITQEKKVELYQAILCSLSIGTLISIFPFIKNRNIRYYKEKFDKKTHLSLLYSIISIALLFNYEKIVININFSKEIFADYFFAYTVLFMPVNVIASYISQVALIDFKDHKKGNSFIKNIDKCALITSIILFIYFIFICFFMKYISVNIETQYIIYFFIFSTLKILDSLLSSLLSLHATHAQIIKLNKYPNIFIVFLLIITCILPSIQIILLSQLFLWSLRVFLYYKLTKKLNLIKI